MPQHQPPQPHPPPTQPSFPCSFCPSCQPPSPSAAACQLPGGFLAVEPPTPRPIHQTPIARPLIAWVILVRRARWFDRRRAVQPAFSIPRHTDESCCMAPRQPTHPYPPPPSVTVPCSCARVQHFPGLPLPCSLLPWTAPMYDPWPWAEPPSTLEQERNDGKSWPGRVITHGSIMLGPDIILSILHR